MLGMRFLKVAASDLMTWDLRRNREHRNAIPMAIKKTIDEMKIARPATACTHRDFTSEMGLGPGGKRGPEKTSHAQLFGGPPEGS